MVQNGINRDTGVRPGVASTYCWYTSTLYTRRLMVSIYGFIWLVVTSQIESDVVYMNIADWLMRAPTKVRVICFGQYSIGELILRFGSCSGNQIPMPSKHVSSPLPHSESRWCHMRLTVRSRWAEMFAGQDTAADLNFAPGREADRPTLKHRSQVMKSNRTKQNRVFAFLQIRIFANGWVRNIVCQTLLHTSKAARRRIGT